MATEKAIKFEIDLTEVKNHFEMIVKEDGIIALEVYVFKVYEEIKEFEIKKISASLRRYISLVMNNLLSSRKVIDEFPILKQVERKLENKLKRS